VVLLVITLIQTGIGHLITDNGHDGSPSTFRWRSSSSA
jgi:hypothetical protein